MLLFKNPYYQGKKSDHFDGKRFFNPWNQGAPTIWDVIKWKWQANKRPWPEHCLPLIYNDIKKHSKKDHVIFLGHSGFLIVFDGIKILIDPIYSSFAGPFKSNGLKRRIPPGVDFKHLPKIDLVLISHSHYDHLDIHFLKKLNLRDRPFFIVPLGVDEILKKQMKSLKSKCLDWHESTLFKSLRVFLTPAQHWSARHLFDKNYTLWGGFILKSKKKTIYFAGDTGYHSQLFKKIHQEYGKIDLALLPIGAYKPRWFMKYSHLDPSDALKACIDLGKPQCLAMHHRSFPLADEGMHEAEDDLLIALKNRNISHEKFYAIHEGESFLY